ncbi:helix-turn-helix domain-containing protein [Parabacteroides sp. Marseille-P3160]|uniref:helix-turn-helix domain-containing protein n=1 Tax=Parabacteroides sp. Marseille-P3160 TaxID=1917887 RepID=UPI0009B9ED6A|nr:helix-turn-helix transcriptional regulator [Parabacteroides sp. Marseille-P3160]
MNTKDNMLTDISAELNKEFGTPGTPERVKFDEEAYAFYTGQILLGARREAKVTQSELAKRINVTKSYISRIENGSINPSVATFYRIMNALGLRIEIVKLIAGM